MTIITISRGSYSRGKELAEKLAAKLNYKCVSREVLLGTCGQFKVPEKELTKAIKNAPSILNRFTREKEQYINRIRATLLEYAQNDNIVYHGLAGQFFLKDIPNVVKVCLIADMEYRIKTVMEVENISRKGAMSLLKKIDEERVKWGRRLYGIKPFDPILFDLVINIRNLTVDDAVGIIAYATEFPCFQATPESREMLKNKTIKAQIVALLDEYPNADISVKEGRVHVGIDAPLNQKDRITQEVKESIERIKGVEEIEITLETKST
ncbi:cytidylate kinase-like family protein [bacterium]|nr:cytidylate kinase-like family protein [bacterium]